MYRDSIGEFVYHGSECNGLNEAWHMSCEEDEVEFRGIKNGLSVES